MGIDQELQPSALAITWKKGLHLILSKISLFSFPFSFGDSEGSYLMLYIYQRRYAPDMPFSMWAKIRKWKYCCTLVVFLATFFTTNLGLQSDYRAPTSRDPDLVKRKNSQFPSLLRSPLFENLFRRKSRDFIIAAILATGKFSRRFCLCWCHAKRLPRDHGFIRNKEAYVNHTLQSDSDTLIQRKK